MTTLILFGIKQWLGNHRERFFGRCASVCNDGIALSNEWWSPLIKYLQIFSYPDELQSRYSGRIRLSVTLHLTSLNVMKMMVDLPCYTSWFLSIFQIMRSGVFFKIKFFIGNIFSKTLSKVFKQNNKLYKNIRMQQ